MAWLDQAACAGRDPAMWDFDQPGQWRAGVAICATCPVKAECLAAAMVEEADSYAKEQRAMIRGGLTPLQRARLAAGKPPGEAEKPRRRASWAITPRRTRQLLAPRPRDDRGKYVVAS